MIRLMIVADIKASMRPYLHRDGEGRSTVIVLSTVKSEVQVLMSLGNLPPLAASFPMICLCNQTFMVAESLVSPV